MSDLTAKELVTRHRALEHDISVVVQNLVNDFQQETGFSVGSISVTTTDIQQFNEPKTRSLITGVDVGINLY